MTIEERANQKYCDKNGDVIDMANDYKRIGYIQGATEQKAIDIDKACEWLKENLEYYVGEGDWNVWDCKSEETAMDVIARDFRKAMEE